MGLGWIALIIAVSAVAFWIISIVVLATSSLGIVKTARYGYKDIDLWVAKFKELEEKARTSGDSLNGKLGEIKNTADEIKEKMDQINETFQEINSHPLVKLARWRARR